MSGYHISCPDIECPNIKCPDIECPNIKKCHDIELCLHSTSLSIFFKVRISSFLTLSVRFGQIRVLAIRMSGYRGATVVCTSKLLMRLSYTVESSSIYLGNIYVVGNCGNDWSFRNCLGNCGNMS